MCGKCIGFRGTSVLMKTAKLAVENVLELVGIRSHKNLCSSRVDIQKSSEEIDACPSSDSLLVVSVLHQVCALGRFSKICSFSSFVSTFGSFYSGSLTSNSMLAEEVSTNGPPIPIRFPSRLRLYFPGALRPSRPLSLIVN